MRDLVTLLQGRKTYIIAAVAAVLNFCVAVGWLTVDQVEQINIILGALGLAALRAGVNKI